MSYALDRCRELEAELAACRKKHGLGDPKEDKILEELARVWWELTDEEQKELNDEVSRL